MLRFTRPAPLRGSTDDPRLNTLLRRVAYARGERPPSLGDEALFLPDVLEVAVSLELDFFELAASTYTI